MRRERNDNEERDCDKIRIGGMLEEEFAFSHITAGMKYYAGRLSCMRISGEEDHIPLIAPKWLKPMRFSSDQHIVVEGSVRTFGNKKERSRRRSREVFVYANSIELTDIEEDDENEVELEGCVCGKPVFRVTPSGTKIAKVLIVVKRDYGKASFIPCIAWNKSACWVNELEAGEKVSVLGRLQSREYLKNGELRHSYELFIIGIGKI